MKYLIISQILIKTTPSIIRSALLLMLHSFHPSRRPPFSSSNSSCSLHHIKRVPRVACLSQTTIYNGLDRIIKGHNCRPGLLLHPVNMRGAVGAEIFKTRPNYHSIGYSNGRSTAEITPFSAPCNLSSPITTLAMISSVLSCTDRRSPAIKIDDVPEHPSVVLMLLFI